MLAASRLARNAALFAFFCASIDDPPCALNRFFPTLHVGHRYEFGNFLKSPPLYTYPQSTHTYGVASTAPFAPALFPPKFRNAVVVVVVARVARVARVVVARPNDVLALRRRPAFIDVVVVDIIDIIAIVVVVVVVVARRVTSRPPIAARPTATPRRLASSRIVAFDACSTASKITTRARIHKKV